MFNNIGTCLHYARGIWGRKPVENTSNVFRPHYVAITGHFGLMTEQNSVREFKWFIVSKSYVLNFFSIHAKMKSRRFHIPPVWRAFLKCSIFVPHYCGGSGPNRRKNSCIFKYLPHGVDATLKRPTEKHIALIIEKVYQLGSP